MQLKFMEGTASKLLICGLFQKGRVLAQDGRRAIQPDVPILVGFQSTPPAEARGDSALRADLPRAMAFQSTPPAEARGDSAT